MPLTNYLSRFDRNRPWWWDYTAIIHKPHQKGNEWMVNHDPRDDTLVCESCGSTRGMIVNDPFDPEKPVDVKSDEPKQILCRGCCKQSLPEESDYV